MATITLETIHKDQMELKREVEHIKVIVEEDYDLADDVIEEIQASRTRSKSEFVSHEEMKDEFG